MSAKEAVTTVAVAIAVTDYPPERIRTCSTKASGLTLDSGVKAIHWVRVDNSGEAPY